MLGQNKLFDEIVGKGNQVVIAFNQLSGSPAFLCALNDKHFFECIVRLFRYGYIRLVRYETQDDDGNTIKVRTAAQYMILSIEKAMKGTYRFPKWIFCDEDKEIFPVIVEAPWSVCQNGTAASFYYGSIATPSGIINMLSHGAMQRRLLSGRKTQI